MNRAARTPLVAAALLALAACAAPAPPAGPTFTDADMAAIRSTADIAMEMVNSSGSWEGYVDAYYAPDAIVNPPNATSVQGREAILAFLETFPPITLLDFEWISSEGAGDMAYVHGTYQMDVLTPDGPMSDYGKYVEVWKRQPTGEWRIAIDIFNSDLPVPGTPEEME